MKNHYMSFGSPENIKIITEISEIQDENISYFNVSDRTYTKRLSENEISFMKYLLPTKAKFTPLKKIK